MAGLWYKRPDLATSGTTDEIHTCLRPKQRWAGGESGGVLCLLFLAVRIFMIPIMCYAYMRTRYMEVRVEWKESYDG